jgi:hypothetical protein
MGTLKGRILPLGITSKVCLRLWLLPLLIKEPRRNLSPHPLLEATLLAAVPIMEVRDQMKLNDNGGTQSQESHGSHKSESNPDSNSGPVDRNQNEAPNESEQDFGEARQN